MRAYCPVVKYGATELIFADVTGVRDEQKVMITPLAQQNLVNLTKLLPNGRHKACVGTVKYFENPELDYYRSQARSPDPLVHSPSGSDRKHLYMRSSSDSNTDSAIGHASSGNCNNVEMLIIEHSENLDDEDSAAGTVRPFHAENSFISCSSFGPISGHEDSSYKQNYNQSSSMLKPLPAITASSSASMGGDKRSELEQEQDSNRISEVSARKYGRIQVHPADVPLLPDLCLVPQALCWQGRVDCDKSGYRWGCCP